MKTLVLILAITFCVASVYAEGENNGNTMNPTAKTFVDSMTTFANNNFPTEEQDAEFNKTAFINEINELGNKVKAIEDKKDEDGKVTEKGYNPADHFTPDDFTAGINAQLALAVSAGINDCPNIKAAFMFELSFFIKGYLEDMERGGVIQGDATVRLTTQQYIDDIAALVNGKKKEIDYEKNPPAEDNSNKVNKYDPEKYLDTVLGDKSAKRSSAKIDFYWGGRYGNWNNKSLKYILDQFKSYFGDVVQADIDALTDIWPQGAEVYTMNNAGYTTPNVNTPKSFELNEYGKLADYSEDTKKNAKDKNKQDKDLTDEEKHYRKQFVDPTSKGARNDYTHNNRNWSGIPDGTYTTVKLTTNGREYTMQQHFYTSPIVLDMDGDSKLEASKGEWLPHEYNGSKLVEFDMDGDGFIDLSEWVGPNDGLLMVSGTTEVSANELFGNAGGFMDGYEKLSLLDKNKDSKLTGQELATLSVWQDKNGNAKIDAGEVATVVELGITSINVKADDNSVSSFEHNGTTKKVWDWYPVVYTVKRTR